MDILRKLKNNPDIPKVDSRMIILKSGSLKNKNKSISEMQTNLESLNDYYNKYEFQDIRESIENFYNELKYLDEIDEYQFLKIVELHKEIFGDFIVNKK